ncbi:MAG: hypothetical protein K0R02_1105 [Rickettsiaceae bacterium]|jgi:hypothetical protein|nr:hypothetical protein [Rickettsiaceae bacterium]
MINNELKNALAKYGFKSVNEKKPYNNQEISPLEAAVLKEDFISVELFLKYGADSKDLLSDICKEHYKDINYYGNSQHTHNENIKLLHDVSKIAATGQDINLLNSINDKPYLEEQIEKNKELVVIVLSRGFVKPNIEQGKSLKTHTPYIYAAIENIKKLQPESDIIELILKANKDNIFDSLEILNLSHVAPLYLDQSNISKIVIALRKELAYIEPSKFLIMKLYCERVKIIFDEILIKTKEHFDTMSEIPKDGPYYDGCFEKYLELYKNFSYEEFKQYFNDKADAIYSDYLNMQTLGTLAFRNILKQIEQDQVLDMQKLGKSIAENTSNESDKMEKLAIAYEMLFHKASDINLFLTDSEQDVVSDLLLLGNTQNA